MRDEWSILDDELCSAAACGGDTYRIAKKWRYNNIINEQRRIEEACMEPRLRAAMTLDLLATENLYQADTEDWPEGPEFDALTIAEADAFDALVDTPCESLEALLQKFAYIRLKQRSGLAD
jgi:hypothetical protein